MNNIETQQSNDEEAGRYLDEVVSVPLRRYEIDTMLTLLSMATKHVYQYPEYRSMIKQDTIDDIRKTLREWGTK